MIAATRAQFMATVEAAGFTEVAGYDDDCVETAFNVYLAFVDMVNAEHRDHPEKSEQQVLEKCLRWFHNKYGE